MVLIAGEEVKLNDVLYSRRAGASGKVVALTETTVTLRITKEAGSRDYIVQSGGVVNGEREVYWHAPLELDLPKSKVGKLQRYAAVLRTLTETF